MAFEPASRKEQHYVNRLKDRASYDEVAVFSAVDQCPVAHVTFKLPEEVDDYPSVIPMIFGRKNQTKALSEDATKCCATFTNVTGLVVSLTAFHNSNNYNSAVVYGLSRLVEDEAEKADALTLITNNAFRVPGTNEVGDRWNDGRPTSNNELKSTRVVALDIQMASAKVRDGPPGDDKADIESHSGEYWSGVVVRESKFTKAIPSSYNRAPMPAYIERMLQ